MRALTGDVKIVRVRKKSVGGVTQLVGDTVDLAGFDGCMFVTSFGVLLGGAIAIQKVQQDSDSAFGTPADLAGTALQIPEADDDKILVVDIFRPSKQFLRIVIDRTVANTEVNDSIAILYRTKKAPTVNDVSVSASKVHVTPAEGTP